MGIVSFTYTLTNGTTGDATQVQASLDQLNNAFPAAASSLLSAGSVTATLHGNCTATSGTATHHAARQVVLNDASGLFTTDNVETGMYQLAKKVLGPAGSLGAQMLVGTDYSDTDPTECSVTVAANTAVTGLIVMATCRTYSEGNVEEAMVPVYLNDGTISSALSTAGNRARRYELSTATGAGEIFYNKPSVMTTIDANLATSSAAWTAAGGGAFDATKQYIVSLGAQVDIAGTTSECTYFSLFVYAY